MASPAETTQELDLSLLSEADLADDPHPDRPLRLEVLGHSDDPAGGRDVAVEIRTTPEQLRRLVAKWRALQLGLADRARKQALAELEQESPVDRARLEALAAERAGRPDMTDPLAHVQLLDRLRRGLEKKLGPVPQDLPPDEPAP